MRGNVTVMLVLLAGLVLPGCAINRISGSGNVITEPRTVQGVSAVTLSGSGVLRVEQGEAESLSITADDNLLPHLKSDVSGNRLELGTQDSLTNLSPSKEITYKLTVKDLRDIEISGSAAAEAKGIRTPKLQISISGSGRVSAEGGADDLAVNISGSGVFQGSELKSKRADIDISGSGDADVAVSEKIDAHVSGSGSITYTGEPQIDQRVSGSGSVRKRR